MERTSQEKI